MIKKGNASICHTSKIEYKPYTDKNGEKKFRMQWPCTEYCKP